jgi:hypothetical protein
LGPFFFFANEGAAKAAISAATSARTNNFLDMGVSSFST